MTHKRYLNWRFVIIIIFTIINIFLLLFLSLSLLLFYYYYYFYWSSDINEGVKAVLFLKQKKDESKSFAIGKLVKVSSYIPTFTNLLNPTTKKKVSNALKKHLRGKKSPICFFEFLCFLCAFCAFCAFLCIKQKKRVLNALKKHLRGKKSPISFYAF